MTGRILGMTVVIWFLAQPAFGQVHSPKVANDLQARYRQLKCSLAVIHVANRVGTGFYIDSAGTLLTASHVLGDRVFSQPENSPNVTITLPIPKTITIKDIRGEYSLQDSSVEDEPDNWAVDLAVIHTQRPTTCWLAKGDDKHAAPGQPVITLGFPGLAFGSLSIYTGIVSAVNLKSDLINAITIERKALKSPNEFIRVQMPISSGISGAPIVDERNRAIAVVTQAGAWGPDLELLTQVRQRMIESGAPMNNLDWPIVTGHLAELFRDFLSPGYGDSVPLSYLVRKGQPPRQKPAEPAH